MEIIYPPLVEQGFHYYFDHQEAQMDKSTFYRSMVEKGIITETGLPTEKAIATGLVKDYYEAENLSFHDFLQIYPVFNEYDQEIFQLIDGFWEIPISIKEELFQDLKAGKYSFDEVQQIESYLEER